MRVDHDCVVAITLQESASPYTGGVVEAAYWGFARREEKGEREQKKS
jgi:hypothetical protein